MFGCGEAQATFDFGNEFVDSLLNRRRGDRLRQIEEIDQASLDSYLTSRGRVRRALLKAGGMLGLLSAAGPLASRPADAAPPPREPADGKPSPVQSGRLHTVPSTLETVRSGVFDSTRPDILEIEPGDIVVYPNTWTHYLNKLNRGLTIEQIGELRKGGGHSIIGPVAVHGAEPGDVIAVHFERLEPSDWGVNYNNPGSIGTGTLPDDFPQGQVHYFDLDLDSMTTEFLPGITLPLAPFQGVFATGPEGGGIVSSVPPDRYGGNMDLRDLTEGSTLYLPVWQSGGRMFTGDSHALQGDGEVNITAVETAMREVRIRVDLHKQAGWQWPFAETDSHWYALGMDPDLNEALRIALRNALDFLEQRAGLTRLDAYSLASIALSFRITQSVDINKGVHAMIPKSIFSQELRQSISIV